MRAKLRNAGYLALQFSRKQAKRLLLLKEVQAVLGDAGADEPATSQQFKTFLIAEYQPHINALQQTPVRQSLKPPAVALTKL